jgi:hypothetical protein
VRLQSAQTPCGNLCALETFQSYRARATAVNPLPAQDFHLFSTVRGGSIQSCSAKGELFTARPKTRLHFDQRQIPARAEAEDDSKIKDRWEALLFAETLQGTLSPNANPGKGSIGGLLNWMPKAAARVQRAAQTLVHLSSTQCLYQTPRNCARGLLLEWFSRSSGHRKQPSARPANCAV